MENKSVIPYCFVVKFFSDEEILLLQLEDFDVLKELYLAFLFRTDIKVQQYIREKDLIEVGDNINLSMTKDEYIELQRTRQMVVNELRALENK